MLSRSYSWFTATRAVGVLPTAPFTRRRQHTIVLTALLVAVTGLRSTAGAAEYPFSAQIVFGYGESSPARWTGSIRAENTRVTEIKGWLFRNADRIDLNTFELHTRHPVRPIPARKGLIVRGSAGPGGRIHVSTGHGDFSFTPESLNPRREQPFLGGLVRVSGMGPVEKLTNDSRYDDYPSIAVGENNKAWVVWQSYSGRQDEIRIRKYDQHWRTFSRVPGVSGDVWRPQVALDARQRPWVVWSQQVGGNFDIYARVLDEETNSWGEMVRLSSHPNPDIDHHLVSDSQGRLWLVWQGFHGDNSDIFLSHYDGTSWSKEIRISDHPANDWEPKVAVDKHGRAHVVWDSYRDGNYDVLLRSYAQGEPGPVKAVAGTPRPNRSKPSRYIRTRPPNLRSDRQHHPHRKSQPERAHLVLSRQRPATRCRLLLRSRYPRQPRNRLGQPDLGKVST